MAIFSLPGIFMAITAPARHPYPDRNCKQFYVACEGIRQIQARVLRKPRLPTCSEPLWSFLDIE
jgi:hypothetical protein